MQRAADTTQAAPAEELASAVGHALNNVLPFLYAASSFLDGEDGPPDTGRARRAVDDACRGARILGAALATLGLSSADTAGLPPFAQRIDAEALATILSGAEAAAGARIAVPAVHGLPLATTLDVDSIAALVSCAATAVRRACGPAAALACGATMDAARTTLAIEVSAEPRPATSARRGAPGPSELALAHAARILGALDARVDVVSPGHVRLAIAARRLAEGAAA